VGAASLEQRQWFQQLFFPYGIAFDGKGFVGTGVTAPAFSHLQGIETANYEGLVDQNSASWNQIHEWHRRVEMIRQVASAYLSANGRFIIRASLGQYELARSSAVYGAMA